MCGISGIYSKTKGLNESDVEKVKKMNQLLSHRGPDDEGIFISKDCILGHRRLAIIDLSNDGHQPFHSEDNQYTIVFNGEIYNYLELRSELQGKGRKFRTKTDTEVLLQSFLEWGVDSFHKLNGMFAFALYNNKDSELYLVRDRFGVKPLYYVMDEQRLYFASEILPLLNASNFAREANDQMIYDYLAYNRTNHTHMTFFKGFYRLPHGSYLHLKEDTFNEVQWYKLNAQTKIPFKDKLELVESLKESISLRLRSDVPVGTSLSGGIDSSSIACLASLNQNNQDIFTFSAVYPTNHRSNEREAIESLSGKGFKMSFVYPDAETLFQELEAVVAMLNEPVPSTSVYASFKVYEFAKKYVKVMLDGQGADESLGGYGYFRGVYYIELIKKFRILDLIKQVYEEIFLTKSYEGIKAFFFYLLPSSLKESIIRSQKKYLGKKIRKCKASPIISNQLWNASSLRESFLAHFEFKLEHLLTWGDKTSMANSIEVRYPFLDYRFVEKAIGIEGENLFKNGFNKAILRDAVKGIVSESILEKRAKVGFETPEDEWFRLPLFQNLIWKLLDSELLNSRGYINSKKAKKLYQKHLDKKINISGEIWKWINLELWCRNFIDQKTFLNA